ncbi:MAG TPA: CsbD family protein [Gammaproteobacteria bacterium]|nr:CsbD family protein [Gammaproteobacteria bacterium]
MNSDIIKGNWKEIKGKIRQQWGKLTDDDVSKMQGTYEELTGKLQSTYGYQKEQADKEIDGFLKANKFDNK